MKQLLSLVIFFIAANGYAQTYSPEKNNTKMKVQPVVPIKVYAFNLTDVRLLNSPFAHAMQMDSAYLMLLVRAVSQEAV